MIADIERYGQDIKLYGRTIVRGELHGRNVLALVGGIGKAAIAASTAYLIASGSRNIILTGTAGRVSEKLSKGDIVVATHLVQHDFSVYPLLPPYVIPSPADALKSGRLPADPSLVTESVTAATRFVNEKFDGRFKVVPRASIEWGSVQELRPNNRFPGPFSRGSCS